MYLTARCHLSTLVRIQYLSRSHPWQDRNRVSLALSQSQSTVMHLQCGDLEDHLCVSMRTQGGQMWDSICLPGHILLPKPKAKSTMSSFSIPSASKNLSGMNISGLGYLVSSRDIPLRKIGCKDLQQPRGDLLRTKYFQRQLSLSRKSNKEQIVQRIQLEYLSE